MQFASIRTKFLAFILPVVLVGFLIFFGISYKMSSDMLDKNAEMIGTGLGKQVSLDAQRVFETNKAHLDELSRDAAILQGDRAARVAKLRDVKEHTDVFSNVFYLEPDGIGYDYEDRANDRRERDYYKKAMQTGKAVVSEPVISAITGKVVVIIAVPVVQNGTITGIVGGVMRDNFINETPLVFRKEIYALACVMGGTVFAACYYFHLGHEVSELSAAGTILVIRILAIKYHWHLPKMKRR